LLTPPRSRATLFPYTTLFRSLYGGAGSGKSHFVAQETLLNMLSSSSYSYLVVRKTSKSIRNSVFRLLVEMIGEFDIAEYFRINRSEEHTSELQSRFDLVCRLL